LKEKKKQLVKFFNFIFNKFNLIDKTKIMSSKPKVSSSSKYEKEIERLRNENKWMRLRDYANTISAKDQNTGLYYFVDLVKKLFLIMIIFFSKLEILSKFFFAESELENYLFINPLIFPSNLNTETTSIIYQAPKTNDTIARTENLLKEIINKSDNNVLNFNQIIYFINYFFYSNLLFFSF
jgi:hypothetical protein